MLYINPDLGVETKEAFLDRVGKRLTCAPHALDEIPVTHRLVVWKDNVTFTAAGVPSSERDFRDASSSEDWRATRFYVVPLTDLRGVVSKRDWIQMSGEDERIGLSHTDQPT